MVTIRFGDVDQSCPAARRDLIMHAELRFGESMLPRAVIPPFDAMPLDLTRLWQSTGLRG